MNIRHNILAKVRSIQRKMEEIKRGMKKNQVQLQKTSIKKVFWIAFLLLLVVKSRCTICKDEHMMLHNVMGVGAKRPLNRK